MSEKNLTILGGDDVLFGRGIWGGYANESNDITVYPSSNVKGTRFKCKIEAKSQEYYQLEYRGIIIKTLDRKGLNSHGGI